MEFEQLVHENCIFYYLPRGLVVVDTVSGTFDVDDTKIQGTAALEWEGTNLFCHMKLSGQMTTWLRLPVSYRLQVERAPRRGRRRATRSRQRATHNSPVRPSLVRTCQ